MTLFSRGSWLCFPLLLASCATDAESPPPGFTEAPASPPPASGPTISPPVTDSSGPAAAASATIGPDGGRLVHPTGAQLIVPAGALVGATKLSLVRVPAPSAELVGGIALGDGYEAGPSGQTFSAPVELVLPIDPSRLMGGIDPATAQVRMAPKGSSDFVALDSEIDLPNRVLRTRTLHFTQFVPAQSPNPVFITTPRQLADASVGVAYQASLAATGGAAPYTWTLSAGSALPSALALNGGGDIGGVASAPGASSFFVTATDSSGHAVQRVFSLSVVAVPNPAPTVSSIDPTSVPVSTVDTQFDIAGTNFLTTSAASIDGQGIPTSYVSPTALRATIPASYLSTARTLAIAVYNPAPGGGFSATTVDVTVTGTPPEPPAGVTCITKLRNPACEVTTTVENVAFWLVYPAPGSVGISSNSLGIRTAVNSGSTSQPHFLSTDASYTTFNAVLTGGGTIQRTPGGLGGPSQVTVNAHMIRGGTMPRDCFIPLVDVQCSGTAMMSPGPLN